MPNFDTADLSGLSAPVWESSIRKISGFNKPSKANEALFFGAVEEIARTSSRLLRSLETNAPPKDRAQEAAKAHARAVRRFGT